MEFEAKSLSAAPNGGVLVACEGLKTDTQNDLPIHEDYRELGLFVINADGLVHETVARGSFWDVTCDSNFVFALSAKSTHHPQIVSIFDAQQTGSYQLLRHVTLQDYEYERIRVHNIDTVYLSSIITNQIHRYCFQTMNMAEFTSGDKDMPPLDGPLLCMLDGDGNVLISNRAHDKLQVLDSEGEWSVFPVSGVKDPYDAVVTLHKGKHCLFVISEHDDSLYKFSQSFI